MSGSGTGEAVIQEWHLLRTKAGEEGRAHDQVNRLASEVLLPQAKMRVQRRHRLVESVVPLFPCYLFARLDLEREYARLRYTRGIRNVVRFGGEPTVVPEWVIDELKQRCMRGPVELPHRQLLSGESVRVLDSPLQEFEGIFSRYRSGTARVEILLSVMGAGARVVLPASMVAPVT